MLNSWPRRSIVGASILSLATAAAFGAGGSAIPAPSSTPQSSGSASDVSAELQALKSRITELEAKENSNWLTQERTEQIRGIVQDVLKDVKTRSQFADGPSFGYKDGFFLQSADGNFKLVMGGFAQLRYEFAQSNAWGGRTITRGVGNNTLTLPDPGNSSGFDVRRARINFSGNAFSPDLTFRLEGDFYGNATGNFTVTDAYIAYRFNDMLRVKVGSYKAPFLKSELTSDTLGQFMERTEAASPFDPVRSLGVSLYGELVPSTVSYEVSANDGGNSNTLRRDDTVGLTPNLDNRLGFYARLQWAGAGKISDFADEADLRDPTKPRDFIWMLGAAAGYESQNATNDAFPSPQNGTTVFGLSNGHGFISPYVLNGDIYRGTVDFSAKYQGLSINTALYAQQINANPGLTNSGNVTPQPAGPSLAPTTANFFQWGGYGQVGYFVIPQKLELVGRVGIIGNEGRADLGEFYSAGANYYVYGNNFKIQSDVTYTPEAAYTDTAASLLQNTHDLIFRMQVQMKF